MNKDSEGSSSDWSAEVPVSSVLCLSSVRELPVQVRDLYAQGFVLVAVHPFVHPCGPRHVHIQRQLHRAVLVRETPSSEKSQLKWSRHRLETDVCVAGNQAADPDVIQSYVKRIQDVAEQGVMFVGFLQQPGGGPCFLGNWDLEELSSLHSSPSPIHRNPFSIHTSPTDPTEPHPNDAEPDRQHEEHKTQTLMPIKPESSQLTHRESSASQDSTIQPDGDGVQQHPSQNPLEVQGNLLCPSPGKLAGQNEGSHRLEDAYDQADMNKTTDTHFDPATQRERLGSSSDSWLSSPELDHKCEKRSSSTSADGKRGVTTHNNNHIRLKSSVTEKKATSPPEPARMQLFALYNHTEELNTSVRFYSLRVPLQVQKESGLITEVDAHWLDHMTQHFTSGANLIDGFFHLREDNDNGVSSVDSVFIFQSSAEEATNTSYDAIVVEQWTVVDGVVVKTDYVPLLQSLAPYGWRLMCVLPTPIVKSNSDGSLSTKQILFLQRPILQRKRKDFKMPNLRGRNKAKKNSAGKTTEETESRSPVMETEMDSLRGNTKEEEEGKKSRDSGRSEGAALQRGGGGEEREGGARHQKAFLFLSGSRASVDDQEEETDIDDVPLSRLEKSVRWTDVCQRDDGGVKEEAKTEERIKQQLFSGVC